MTDWQALPWPQLIGPLVAAEDTLARLDSRLAASTIREGWIARTHVLETCASISLDGGLVDLADLVLRDVNMDSVPSSEVLTRAEQVLAARRRIAKARPRWNLESRGAGQPDGAIRGSRARHADTKPGRGGRSGSRAGGRREGGCLG